MKISRLTPFNGVLFTSSMAAQALQVRAASARLACHRYVKSGQLLRLKRDLYVTRDSWEHFQEPDFFMAANRLQVPSYVSFTTALSYYQVTSQVQNAFVESASTVRSWKKQAGGVQFNYAKLPLRLYTGFVKKNSIFIATPEKAFLDALYLMTLGRYRLDISAIDRSRLKRQELLRQARMYPKKVVLKIRDLWKL